MVKIHFGMTKNPPIGKLVQKSTWEVATAVCILPMMFSFPTVGISLLVIIKIQFSQLLTFSLRPNLWNLNVLLLLSMQDQEVINFFVKSKFKFYDCCLPSSNQSTKFVI